MIERIVLFLIFFGLGTIFFYSPRQRSLEPVYVEETFFGEPQAPVISLKPETVISSASVEVYTEENPMPVAPGEEVLDPAQPTTMEEDFDESLPLIDPNMIDPDLAVSCETQTKHCFISQEMRVSDTALTFCVTRAKYCVEPKDIGRTWDDSEIFDDRGKFLNPLEEELSRESSVDDSIIYDPKDYQNLPADPELDIEE